MKGTVVVGTCQSCDGQNQTIFESVEGAETRFAICLDCAKGEHAHWVEAEDLALAEPLAWIVTVLEAHHAA